MSNYVEFGMYWQEYGRTKIKLPDEIDPKDEDAVIEYLKDEWDCICLPVSSSYVSGSDELDEGSLVITHDNEV